MWEDAKHTECVLGFSIKQFALCGCPTPKNQQNINKCLIDQYELMSYWELHDIHVYNNLSIYIHQQEISVTKRSLSAIVGED